MRSRPPDRWVPGQVALPSRSTDPAEGSIASQRLSQTGRDRPTPSSLSEGMFRLSSESAGPFVPHLSRGRPRHVTTEPAETGVRIVSVADFFVFRRRLALSRS